MRRLSRELSGSSFFEHAPGRYFVCGHSWPGPMLLSRQCLAEVTFGDEDMELDRAS